MYYLLSLLGLMVFYLIGVIFFLKHNKKSRIVNATFVSIVFFSYLFCLITIYKSVGLKDWNFINALPVGNVSPFVYSLICLSIFFPKKIKYYISVLVSLLSLPMLFAGLISPVIYFIRDYAFHLHIFMDSFIHVLISLYGIYLVKSKQVSLNKYKDFIIGGSIVIVSALIMLILNIIFRTSFFGLSVYGEHSIYNVVLVDNGIINAIIYFIGVSIVLFIGYFYQKLINNNKNTYN